MFRARKECSLWHFASQLLKARLIVPACDVFATASLQAVAAGLGSWQNRTFTLPMIKRGSYASSRSSLNFSTIPLCESNILQGFPELGFTICSQVSCISRFRSASHDTLGFTKQQCFLVSQLSGTTCIVFKRAGESNSGLCKKTGQQQLFWGFFA